MDTNSYFTIETLTAGNVFIQIQNATGLETPGTIYYWVNSTPNAARDNYTGSIVPSGTAQYIKVNNANPPVGTVIKFYRPETTALCFGDGGDNGSYIKIVGTAETKVSGNMASLIGFSETLQAACFRYMFYSSNIVDASELELPWTTLSDYCFCRMFYNNQKLTKAPVLPAITLAPYCYVLMFRNCIALTKPAKLPNSPDAKENSFAWMYQLCSSMTSIVIEKCNTYSDGSFYGTFQGCTNLVSAEILVRDNYEIPYRAFRQVFRECTSISTIKCMATSFATNAFNAWMGSQPETGTFIKDKDTTWPTGANGIPTGWTIKNMNQNTGIFDFRNITYVKRRGGLNIIKVYGYNNVLLWEGTPGPTPVDYSTEYFTVENTTNNAFNITLQPTVIKDNGEIYSANYQAANYFNTSFTYKISYSFDKSSWTEVSVTGWNMAIICEIPANTKVYLKSTSNRISSRSLSSTTYYNTYTIYHSADYDYFDVSGNIMSLVNGDNFINTTFSANIQFAALFGSQSNRGTNAITNAENLVLPDCISAGCYGSMFYSCSKLLTAPKLPATTLANNCYRQMFKSCSSLTTAPDLPALTLPNNSWCYYYMFGQCTSLNYIKCLATSGLNSNNNLNYWCLNTGNGSGTFVKNSSATWSTTGASGIPTGWTVIDAS